MSQRSVIVGGLVLIGPPINGLFERADVLIEDGLIAAIDPDLGRVDAEIIEAAGKIVLPGFVDTHHHLWETVLRGMTADWSMMQFGWGVRFHHTGAMSPDSVYAGTLAGAVAAVEAGITTSIDHAHVIHSPEHARAGVQAIVESGIRSLWCYGTLDTDTPQRTFSSHEERLDDLRALRSEQFPTSSLFDRVQLGIAANEVGGVPWANTVKEFGIARELDIGLTIHTDSLWSPKRSPEIAWLLHDGLLGPRQTHSHMNAASDDELRMMADTGAGVSSTPETELQMDMGIPVYERAARFGVPAGLGTDIQANNSADPFTMMRVGMHAVNGHLKQLVLETEGVFAVEGMPVTTNMILHHATLGGATVLGLGDVTGSLEVGKAADLVLLETDELHHRPLIDPLATVVMQARVSDLRTVIVAGNVVKRDGVVLDGRAERAGRLIDEAWAKLQPVIEQRGGYQPPLPSPEIVKSYADGAHRNVPPWIEQHT